MQLSALNAAPDSVKLTSKGIESVLTRIFDGDEYRHEAFTFNALGAWTGYVISVYNTAIVTTATIEYLPQQITIPDAVKQIEPNTSEKILLVSNTLAMNYMRSNALQLLGGFKYVSIEDGKETLSAAFKNDRALFTMDGQIEYVQGNTAYGFEEDKWTWFYDPDINLRIQNESMVSVMMMMNPIVFPETVTITNNADGSILIKKNATEASDYVLLSKDSLLKEMKITTDSKPAIWKFTHNIDDIVVPDGVKNYVLTQAEKDLQTAKELVAGITVGQFMDAKGVLYKKGSDVCHMNFLADFEQGDFLQAGEDPKYYYEGKLFYKQTETTYGMLDEQFLTRLMEMRVQISRRMAAATITAGTNGTKTVVITNTDENNVATIVFDKDGLVLSADIEGDALYTFEYGVQTVTIPDAVKNYGKESA